MPAVQTSGQKISSVNSIRITLSLRTGRYQSCSKQESDCSTCVSQTVTRITSLTGSTRIYISVTAVTYCFTALTTAEQYETLKEF